MGADDLWEAVVKSGDDIGCVINGQRGLGHKRKTVWVTNSNGCHIFDGLDQQDLTIGELPHRANRFGVAFMPDHDHLQTVVGVALGLDMDLADQGACCVNIDHFTLSGSGRHRFWHTMGRKDHGAIIGTFVKFFDKNSALIAERINDKLVVNNLVAHIDGRAPFLQRHFHNLDRTVNARAEPAWGSQIKGEGWFGHLTLRFR